VRHSKFPYRFLLLAAICWLPACVPGVQAPATSSGRPAPSALPEQRIEEFENRLQRLQDSIVMLEARLYDQQQAIDNLKTRTRSEATLPETGETASPGTELSGPGELTPTEIYLAAFGDYAAGDYRKSIRGFSRFLQFFPANDYASNARYWLAECYFALGQYQQAITEFDRVFVDHPKSSKAPDALLKKAAALYQMEREQDAIDTLQILEERYPKSSAARKAAESFN